MSVATKQTHTAGRDEQGNYWFSCGCMINTLMSRQCELHAAAPEMLEALEQICNAVEGGVYRPTQEDFTRCEAAIRKAKGEL